MPCRTDYLPDEVFREDSERRFVKASLCAVMTALENAGFDPFSDIGSVRIDWKEAGLTKAELRAWWENHKKEDAVRRKREAEAEARKKLRKAALSKLTPEERKVLGL